MSPDVSFKERKIEHKRENDDDNELHKTEMAVKENRHNRQFWGASYLHKIRVKAVHLLCYEEDTMNEEYVRLINLITCRCSTYRKRYSDNVKKQRKKVKKDLKIRTVY